MYRDRERHIELMATDEAYRYAWKYAEEWMEYRDSVRAIEKRFTEERRIGE
jgi:hypothetical protein